MFLVDRVTGKTVFDTPTERARQKAEGVLIEKGYSCDEILVDYEFEVCLPEGTAKATADILVKVDGHNAIVVMCSPPSVLTPYERLALSCARVLNSSYAVALDLENSVVMRAKSGEVLCRSLDCLPSRDEIDLDVYEIPEDRLEKEKRILITYLNILHCKGCRLERH